LLHHVAEIAVLHYVVEIAVLMTLLK